MRRSHNDLIYQIYRRLDYGRQPYWSSSFNCTDKVFQKITEPILSFKMNETTKELPGAEMLFDIPKYRDVYTRTTLVITLSIICSLIVVLFKENKYLSKYLKYLHIDEIVYIIVGFAMAEVSLALFGT